MINSRHNRLHALSLLRMATDNPSAEFRDDQWEAIDSLVNQRDQLLVVQRTGWGKSFVYFIATRILRDHGTGPTLIVSPLLALMRNQLQAARRLNIRAETINSSNTDEWQEIYIAIQNNEIDALLISPERFANDAFIENVLQFISEDIGMVVVDEAHCISDWGHDFRPNYQRIRELLKRMPNLPILGTTATANERVVKDVSSQLGNVKILRGPLMRESLALQTLLLPSQAERLAWLADHVNSLPGTGIIYTLTKRDAEVVSDWLKIHNITAPAYYSNVSNAQYPDSSTYRLYLEDLLFNNEIKALVATSALGMGYDKSDLGFVIHYQSPGSVVAYYQQVGRAGRGIDEAFGILMSGTEDSDIHEFFRRTAFPEESWINVILATLEKEYGLTIRELEGRINLSHGQIQKAIQFLSVCNPSPVIKIGSEWHRNPVHYQMDHEHIRRLTKQREVEWQEVQNYLEEKGCLMQYLAKALDDPNPRPCGKCASCLGETIIGLEFSHAKAVSAKLFLQQAELPLKCNLQVAKDAFLQYGFRGNLPTTLRAETGRILCRWGDAGWGKVVEIDKKNDYFSEQLVSAVVKMLRERWRPSPLPEWVTNRPSRRNPCPVESLARRLASALDLPFNPVVTKVMENEPQKLQQNRFHQCRNIDGVFSIGGSVWSAPVLLIDDIVDSGWTMTVVAALLRKHDCNSVWPLALATTKLSN